jgi:hypothetical protein
VLLVDGYSGYNDIEKVSSRRRAACIGDLLPGAWAAVV